MKTLLGILLTIITALLLFGCSAKPLIEQRALAVYAQEQVSISAKAGADSYSWKQTEGERVALSDTQQRILRFRAPEVTAESRLVFVLEAHYAGRVVHEQVTVTVLPQGSTDDNTSTGGDTNTTTLKSLKLTIAETTLNKDHNSTITLQATYDDNTTKTPSNIAWLINPNDAVSIQGNTLTALKDSNVTIQAKAGNTLSNKVTLNIYWEVNGYRLPPEPDPKVNNATLLGVDVNHNGVRDDVERWIYDKYKDKHPIHIDIAMQAARGYRLILEKQPKTREEAKSIMGEVDKAIDCQAYYMFSAKYFNEPILLQYKAVDEYFRGKVYFNTKERYDAYIQYDTLLSGDSYTLPSFEEEKAACDFNTSKYEE